jgi:hypothetical protein
MIVDEEVYLQHFGVKGMRWGVRNEQRAANKTARREKRAEKFDVKAKQLETDIKVAQAVANKSRGLRRGLANKKVRELREERDKALTDADLKRQGKLSTTQKKVAIGASVAGAIVATTVTYKLVQSGDGRRIAAKGKAFLTGQELSFKKNPLLADPNLTADQIQSVVSTRINDNTGRSIGSRMNCRRCTFAYELRRRGYDVEATRTTSASGQNAVVLVNALSPGERTKATGKTAVIARATKETIDLQKNPNAKAPVVRLNSIIPGGALSKIDPDIDGFGAEAIFKRLAREPDRSRGEVGVNWMGGGGHSMAYEIINGVPHIFDTQTGRKFSKPDDLTVYAPIAQSAFTRLDNVPLNLDYLTRWVKNA